MNKKITLISSYLLLISAQAFADRPAMEDSPPPMAKPAMPVTTQVVEPAPSAVELSIQQEQASMTQQVTGDALEIQPGETLPVSALDFPRRGMTMEKVKNELGEPLEISDTIGKPPITTWTYNDRVVYFEYSSVVHVVAAD